MTRTEAERLTRIEVLLETAASTRTEDRGAVADELRKINTRLDKIETDIRAANARLTGYEDKGKGVLIGVGILGTGIGAGLLAALAKFLEWFK